MAKLAHAFKGDGEYCEAWLSAGYAQDPQTGGTITGSWQCGYPRDRHVAVVADPPAEPKQPVPLRLLDYNTYEPPKDTRACGCTAHLFHGDCYVGCEFNHCGYRMTPRLHGSEVQMHLGDRDKPSPHQQAQTTMLQLHEWWRELAEVEADQVVAKAVEYGSRDLVEIGKDLARCMGREASDQDAAELGVYFYLRGKLARWTEAVADGRTVSDDTLKDIGVYVRMAQRIRSHGGWPGVKA